MSNKTTLLFDSMSEALGPYSLSAFSVQGQTTISAAGLDINDVITFELLIFQDSYACDPACLPKPQSPDIKAVQKLMCGCNPIEGQAQPVRLTAGNPVVVFDAPQGGILRAVYEGPGLGSSTVWAVNHREEPFFTKDLTPGLRGCPEAGLCEETHWDATGNFRCGVDGFIYDEYKSNCDTTKWEVRGEVTWTDTGKQRCSPMEEVDGKIVYYMSYEQINDCNQPRWVTDEEYTEASRTGNIRHAIGSETDIEAEYRDRCGNLEWFPSEEVQNWIPTGKVECGPMYQEDGVVKYMANREEHNQLGAYRWTMDEEPTLAVDSGEYRCIAGDDDATERKWLDECGNSQWFPGDDLQQWVDTGRTRCGEMFVDDNNLVVYEIEREYRNGCGKIRWEADGEPVRAKLTDKTRPVVGDITEIEEQYIDACENTSWFVRSEVQEWMTSGRMSCGEMFEEDGKVKYFITRQMVNQFGQCRWVEDSTPTVAVNTGETRCVPGDDEAMEGKHLTVCGASSWFPSEEVQVWTANGTERCHEGIIQTQEVNQCDYLRWTDTEVECVDARYIASYVLPDGCGLAYRPSDNRDPAATVELGCDGSVEAYIYPTPRKGATTPVTTCNGCEEALGFAVDNLGCK